MEDFFKRLRIDNNIFVINTPIDGYFKIKIKKLYIWFIHLQKAFDKVNRNIL